MVAVTRRQCAQTSALVAALMSAACASTGGAFRPQPFPTAPVEWAVASPTASPLAASDAAAVVESALDLRGAPYHGGGEDPAQGFDCSGFVRYVFGLHHLEVPRTVTEQYRLGRAVRASDVRAGDLLFFSTGGGGASHVGIALGSLGADEFVHAPSTRGVVRVEHLSAPYWRERFVGARRPF